MKMMLAVSTPTSFLPTCACVTSDSTCLLPSWKPVTCQFEKCGSMLTVWSRAEWLSSVQFRTKFSPHGRWQWVSRNYHKNLLQYSSVSSLPVSSNSVAMGVHKGSDDSAQKPEVMPKPGPSGSILMQLYSRSKSSWGGQLTEKTSECQKSTMFLWLWHAQYAIEWHVESCS